MSKMRRLFGTLCFLAVVSPSALAPATAGLASDAKVFPYPMRKTVLDNGLTVLSVPYDSPGIIAYYTVVRAGSRNEIEPGKSGFAHFFEHMMFRGTRKYSSEQYNNAYKAIGADTNAFTTDDWTAYHAVASSAALEKIIDLESDRFMNLHYSEEAFKTEAGAILGEYNKNYSVPFQTLFERLRDTAFTAHTYKHTTMGFLKDIQDMPNQYEYSLKFFDRWYRPENCLLVVVGDFNQENLMALIKKYYGGWQRGSYQADVPAEPPPTQEKVAHVEWKNPTLPYLAIAYRGPAYSDRDIEAPTLDVISQLVFSESAPLYRKLVIEKQWVEFIAGDLPDHRDPYLFTILARVKDAKNMDAVRDEIYAALEGVKSNPVLPERLAAIQSNLRYSFAMALDNPSTIARTMGHFGELTGDPESVNRTYALYQKVTPEDIMRVARKYFVPENRTVVTLSRSGAKKP
ncbi:MAG TPA: pitrilysin family protein [Candidatus Acidoferrales bacterium]